MDRRSGANIDRPHRQSPAFDGGNSRRFGQRTRQTRPVETRWTTMCPFCAQENVATIEIFGGMIPKEFDKKINKSISFSIMNLNPTPKGISTELNSRKQFQLWNVESLSLRINKIINNAYKAYPTTNLPHSFPKINKSKEIPTVKYN